MTQQRRELFEAMIREPDDAIRAELRARYVAMLGAEARAYVRWLRAKPQSLGLKRDAL
jgi:hypothetical protein